MGLFYSVECVWVLNFLNLKRGEKMEHKLNPRLVSSLENCLRSCICLHCGKVNTRWPESGVLHFRQNLLIEHVRWAYFLFTFVALFASV